jgi:hypothetical protein
MLMSSRPDENNLSLSSFTVEELQLIGAYVSVTVLGHGHPYRMAAYSLLNKLDEYFDSEFCQDSFDQIDMEVRIEDDHGNLVSTVSKDNFAILV